MNPAVAIPSPLSVVLYIILLLIGAGLQSTAAAGIAFRGAHPDFVLTIALSAALLSDASVGCLAGFGAGLVMTSVVGRTLGTFLVSRTIAGYVAGLVTKRLYRGNAGVVLLGVFIGSIIAEIVYGLSDPRLTLSHWVQTTLLGAGMNAVLALPMTVILRYLGWGKGRL
jgi:rod shape-determining protein MreD